MNSATKLRATVLSLSTILAALAGSMTWSVGTAGAEETPAAAANKVDFTRDIQPVFRARCGACHGATKQESDFRLDQRAAAFKGGVLGVAIVPGNPDESELLRRILSTDEAEQMPPKGDRLSAKEIDQIRRWIKEGAAWPADAADAAKADPRQHWAFQAPVRPPLPEVKQPQWVRADLDRFVLSRLEREGLTPAAEADPVTLVRRLYLDLTGLPPGIAEVDAFLRDERPDAYTELVERLLASPHYGERWGRQWLDAARYADSDGYEKDKSRQVWFYRDWVVGAFNRDLPYDQFVIEQLAGDLLPDATQDQIVATGFLRNSMLNEEGAIDPEQFRMEAMFDRMDAVGKSILGLTIQCAQCHTHKFDPLTQEEYYRLFAYLNNDHESQQVVYTPDKQQAIDGIRRDMERVETELRSAHPDWEARLAAWEAALPALPAWEVLSVMHQGDNSQRYYYLEDKSVLAQGYAPTKLNAVFQGTSQLPEIRAFRLEQLNDPNLPASGPGRSFKGTSALTEFTVKVSSVQDPTQNRVVTLTKATADFENQETALEPNFDDRTKRNRVIGPVQYAIDGKEETAWGIDAGPGRRNQPRQAVFTTEENVAYPGGTVIEVTLSQKHGGWNSDDHMNHNLGRFRLSVAAEGTAVADPLPPPARRILGIAPEQRTPEQKAALFSAWRALDPSLKTEQDQIEALWKQWPAGSTSLVLKARAQPRETHMLNRGDFLKPGRSVAPGTPAFLHPLPDDKAPETRLTLARWLVDRRSPTTARAFVNRVWQAYFGTGLVETPEDFGLQSDPPSHPGLLDWLACEFMDQGWSIKTLHRRIVHSATYRQSSRVTPAQLVRDPYNRLLGRGSRIRVEGEAVRDVALAASGLLDRRIGGASIFAPAPAFLFMPPASYGPFTWTEAEGADRYRRALYTFRRRSTPYPMLSVFDVPNADFSCVRRTRSNTPLQALTTLNEPVFMECARALGLRLLNEGGATDDERVTYGFRLCLARPPAPDERQTLLDFLAAQRRRIAEGGLNAVQVATGKADTPLPLAGDVNPAEWAAHTILARVLLNLDETITRE